MLQDYKLALRMLIKYPGLTIAGGLALAVAIGIGAGWYDIIGKFMAPGSRCPKGTDRHDRDAEHADECARTARRARLPRMAARAAHDRRPRGVSRGHPKPHHRQRGARADPDGRAHAAAFRTARVPPSLAVACSTPTNCREHPASSCSDTTCGSAPSAAGATSSVRLSNWGTHQPP